MRRLDRTAFSVAVPRRIAGTDSHFPLKSGLINDETGSTVAESANTVQCDDFIVLAFLVHKMIRLQL